MAPRPRRAWPVGSDPARARHAAGLLLLFPIEERTHVVLTVRSQAVRHAGQVSLPGGVVESGETIGEAAIREAREEVALTEPVRIIGTLTPLDIPVSGFRLHPVLAVTQNRPLLSASDGEVARVLELPLATLLDPATVAWRAMTRGGQAVDAPAFVVGDIVIWGATAMVLAELLAMLGWTGPAE
jgi:8-oxo-dGTP pyrophosphatase MutT (NUDIX family)